MCQRAHGAAFVTWVGVDAGQLEVLADDTLRWYASSAQARRGFCSRCGSSLFFESGRWPGEIHVVRASVRGSIDREPQAHVFTASAVTWYHGSDARPRRS
jgi:hypothetical protein